MEKKLTKEEFIAKKKYSKNTVVREYDDSELLSHGDLSCSIDIMIAFCNKAKKDLKDKKNIEFNQNWSGYESCTIDLNYDDIETDEEFEHRIDEEYDNYLYSYNKRVEEKRECEYKRRLKELNKQYGKV